MNLGYFIGTFLFWASTFTPLYAQELWDNNLSEAYELTMDLEYAKSAQKLTQCSENQRFHVLYVKAYWQFIHALMHDDKNLSESALDKLDKYYSSIKSWETDSPYRQLYLGEIQLLKALILGKTGQQLSSGLQVLGGSKKLLRCSRQHPDFVPALLGSGILNVSIAKLPSKYQSVAKFFGLVGDYEVGLQQLEDLLQYTFQEEWRHLHVKAAFAFAFVRNELDGNYLDLEDLGVAWDESILLSYAQANYYIKKGANQKALEVLQYVPVSKREEFVYIDYLEGRLRSRMLLADAGIYLARYIRNNRGYLYKNSARKYWAYSALINDDTLTYQRQQVLAMQEEHLPSEADKMAKREMLFSYKKRLIAARMCFEAKNYNEVISLLEDPLASTTWTEMELLERHYRLGVAYYEMKEYVRAKEQLTAILALPFYSDVHWQPYSAYYLMLMAKSLGKQDQAKLYRAKCLAFEDYPFESDLEMLVDQH